ncbi:MAG: carboxymuconolactone decarboxylase family protein [Nitrospinaceae bacterium]|nr:carboxymuconolactone decarboxylase family protein [Nitrospinaceae bacterium]
MARIEPTNPKDATGIAKDLLDGVQAKFGKAPNIFKTMAHSPAALEGFLQLHGALAGGVLSEPFQEQVALCISEINRCNYCLSAHTAIGKGVGLSEEEVIASRRGVSTDSKTQAGLEFASKIVSSQGWVSDDEYNAVTQAGYSSEEIIEIVALVAKNIFANYFNHIAGTAIDFPAAPSLKEV